LFKSAEQSGPVNYVAFIRHHQPASSEHTPKVKLGWYFNRASQGLRSTGPRLPQLG